MVTSAEKQPLTFLLQKIATITGIAKLEFYVYQ